jgi:hypothetical protein
MDRQPSSRCAVAALQMDDEAEDKEAAETLLGEVLEDVGGETVAELASTLNANELEAVSPIPCTPQRRTRQDW